jgi:hypothetical protein
MVTKAEGIEMDSAGLATQRYKIYLQGLEATANKFTATWQELWMKTFNSDTIKTIISAGTWILQLSATMGGLIPIISLVAGAFLLLNFAKVTAGVQSLISSISIAKTALLALAGLATATGAEMAVATAGISLLLGALVAIGYATYQYYNSIERYTKNLDDLSNAVDNLSSKVSSARDVVSTIKGLSEDFDKLKNNTSKSNDEQERWTDIQNQLKTLMPEINGDYDDQGNFILDNNIQLQTLVDLKQKELDLDRQLLELKKPEEIKAAADLYEQQAKKLKLLNDEQQILVKLAKGSGVTTPDSRIYSIISDLNGKIAEQAIIVQQAKLKYDELSFSMRGAFESGVPESVRRLSQGLDKTNEALKKAQDLLQNFDLSKLTSQDDSLLKIMDDMQKNGEITISQVEELQKAYPKDYLKWITMEGDQYKLNTEALKKYMAAEVEQLILALQLTDATSDLIPILETYRQQILSGGISAQEQEKAYQDLLKDTIDMIKQETEARKQALQDELSAFKDNIDAEKQALQDRLDNFKSNIDKQKQLIDDRASKQKQHLQDELDGYRRLIDAEKELILQKQREADFQDQVAGKNKEISDIENQLFALQFDNSEEAKAKRLQLESDKVGKIKELDKIQNDNSVDNQINALDKIYTNFEESNKMQQRAIDETAKYQKAALDAQYQAMADNTKAKQKLLDKELKDFEANNKAKQKALDDYLKTTGKLNADAMALLDKRSNDFYQKLLAWNKKYGTSIQDDVITKWNQAFNALQNYNNAAKYVPASTPWWKYNSSPPPGTFHEGGVVGGMPKLAESEIFSKLVLGEIVVTEGQASNFLQTVLPKLFTVANKGNGDINASIEINVAGNLDKEILPNLKEAILETLNTAMKNRGIRRDTFSYSL